MTTSQKSKNSFRTKSLVLPEVRYHPSIRTAFTQDRNLQKATEEPKCGAERAAEREKNRENRPLTPDQTRRDVKSAKLQGFEAEIVVKNSGKKNSPGVRYHPSIRNRLGQNQNCGKDFQMEKETKHDSKTQRSTKSGTKNLPLVKYHPSISNPASHRHEEDRPGPEGDRPGPEGGRPGPEGGRPGPEGGRPGPEGGRPGPEGGRPGPEGGRPGPEGGRPGPERGRPGPEGGRPGPEGGDRVQDQRPASNTKTTKNTKRAAGTTRPGDGDGGTRTTDRTEASATSEPTNAARSDKTRAKKSHKSKHLNPIYANNQESPSPGPDPVLLEPRPGSCLDQDLVDQVEVQTRGQRTNPNWFRFRKNRITASVAHSISNCGFINGTKTTVPQSYVRTVLGESGRVQTRAMSWGVDHERDAVLKYQEQQSAALGRPISVQECGLFIDRARPWLAASPDGIVTDERTGQWLRCLEVKCPFKHRARSVEQAAQDDRSFCLEARNHQGAPQFSLKRTHQYFTQVQVQLAVTGLKMADFVVWTLKDLVVVQVQFDPDFWDQTVSRLERFYSEAVIPALREKSPVWKHEL